MTRLVTDYLDNSAKQYPDKIAFADENRELTFSQLQSESKKIAQHLIDKSIFKSPVVVYLEKSVEVLSCFMGAAYSGNFYTPIDVTMPESRILKIMETLKPSIIITDATHKENAKLFALNTPIALYEEIQNGKIDDSSIKKTLLRVIDTDVLYVLFTSGSTGTPKGVIINQKAVIDYAEWVTETFNISSGILL